MVKILIAKALLMYVFCYSGEPKDVPGHSVPLAGLGGFILIFGFLAFNGGSQGSISNEGKI